MSSAARQDSSASLRHMAVLGIGGFVALLFAGAVALWFVLGSSVFFELLAAGIAYCF